MFARYKVHYTTRLYKQKIANQFAIQVITPNLQNQEIVHKIIFEKLCQGDIQE